MRRPLARSRRTGKGPARIISDNGLYRQQFEVPSDPGRSRRRPAALPDLVRQHQESGRFDGPGPTSANPEKKDALREPMLADLRIAKGRA